MPLEEYVFYFTGFVAMLLTYIWLDEYWLAAYGVPANAQGESAVRTSAALPPGFPGLGSGLIAAAIAYRRVFVRNRGSQVISSFW